MTTTYSAQRYIWDNGQWLGFEPIQYVTSNSHRAAAEHILSKAVASSGPVDQLALKVWAKGKAKRQSDVKLYWRRMV